MIFGVWGYLATGMEGVPAKAQLVVSGAEGTSFDYVEIPELQDGESCELEITVEV